MRLDLQAVTPPPDRRPDDEIAEIVVVCTGNIARSPLCAAMLDREVRLRLGHDAPVWIGSAGTNAVVGAAATEETLAEARARGLDLSRHRATQVDREMLDRADLVLVMTERQREQVVRRLPRTARYCFTLRELLRLLAAFPELPAAAGVRDRVRAGVHRALAARVHVPRPPHAEDVDDPHGLPRAAYRRLGVEFDRLVPSLGELLFGGVAPAAAEQAPGARRRP